MSAPFKVVSLRVNGQDTASTVSPRLLLSELLRDELRLTGTHVGCGTGACGSCTVLLDGEPVRSCLVLAAQADGAAVETIESVGTPGSPASHSGGLPRASRPSMRLLHAGLHHVGRSAVPALGPADSG